jgi:predicted small lipoprotein YifL
MLREFIPVARRIAIASLMAAVIGGCGIKGPLKPPPGAHAAPPPPPPGVELPSAEHRD